MLAKKLRYLYKYDNTIFIKFQELTLNFCKPGLFTSRDCRSGEAAAHEAVVNYCEWAATKPMRQDRLARRVKNADRKKRN